MTTFHSNIISIYLRTPQIFQIPKAIKCVRLSHRNKTNNHKDVDMTLQQYLEPLLKNFRDSRTKKNIGSVFSKIIETKSVKLWSNANDRAEYERLRRVIGKDLKNVLDDKKISEALVNNSSGFISIWGYLHS